ncbi:hypothetical protein [Amycolatopsis sp. cmx-4-68]|uniref:hypothetical protein n=1 Tax=Amycolatopsis sp. cmx-4-68 TaxID=2790938 RepID=UPI00397E2569
MFDDLVAEAAAAPVDGWDFSWLEGRATEARPSWGYQRLLGARQNLGPVLTSIEPPSSSPPTGSPSWPSCRTKFCLPWACRPPRL